MMNDSALRKRNQIIPRFRISFHITEMNAAGGFEVIAAVDKFQRGTDLFRREIRPA